MGRLILIYGTIAGLIAGGVLSFTTIALRNVSFGGWGMAIGYLTMLVAFSTIFMGIRRYREEAGGGVIRFWAAFALGVGISGVASLFYVAAWEATLAMTHMDFARDYAAAVVAQARAKGMSGAALARELAAMERFRRDYANPVYRLPMTFLEIFPVGLLVSFVAAGLLRNPRTRRG